MDARAVGRIGVVVPARNEAADLRRCLGSVAAAAAAVPVPVRVVVVLDSCSDSSAAVVSGAAAELDVPITAISCRAGAVGAARAAGVRHLLAAADTTDAGAPTTTWLATTDADSVVPGRWLARHLELAGEHADLVAGTVTAHGWHVWPLDVRRSYEAAYAVPVRTDGHGHIHGANLGFTAELYRRLGGFEAVTHDEDVALVLAAIAGGAQVAWPDDIPVATSARRSGRTPHGFATHLLTHLDVGTGAGGARLTT